MFASTNPDAAKPSPSSLAAPLARLRARGFDAACSLDEKLAQLHRPTSAEGAPAISTGSTLEHIWRLGKHFALVASNSIDDTTDRDYERRLRATTHSKSLLYQIEAEFELVCKSVGQLTMHYDALLDLLEKFRLVCDGELIHSYDKQKQQLDMDIASLVPDAKKESDGDAAYLSSCNEANAKLEALRKRLRESATTLTEAVKTSCSPMNIVTRTHLEQAQNQVAGKVTKMQCDYDLLRRSLMKGDLGTQNPSHPPPAEGRARSGSGDGIARATLNAITNNPVTKAIGAAFGGGQQGSAHGAEGEAGFSVDEEGNTIINPPLNASGKTNMNSTIPTSAREEMVAANLAYESELQQAKELLHEALEQTSMSTWSCYNVFFSQMAQYFSEVEKGNSDLAKVLISLKNSQLISKKLTKERRERLGLMRKTAELQLEQAFKQETARPALRDRSSTSRRHTPSTASPVDPLDEFFASVPSSHPTNTQRHPPNQPQWQSPTIPDAPEDEFGDFAVGAPPVHAPPARPTYAPSDLDNLFGP